MHRCELIDVATGKHYVREDRRHATPRRSSLLRATTWRQRRPMRSYHRSKRAIAMTAGPSCIGPLLAFCGALGLFYVLYVLLVVARLAGLW